MVGRQLQLEPYLPSTALDELMTLRSVAKAMPAQVVEQAAAQPSGSNRGQLDAVREDLPHHFPPDGRSEQSHR
jgi:hypothetical protein